MVAFGADWQYFFTNFGEVRFYIDRAGLVHLPNGNTRAWEKQEWKEPDAGMGGETGLLLLVEVDCKQHKYIGRDLRPMKGTPKSLKVVGALRSGYVGHWEYFGPNDLDEARFSAWCDTAPRK